MLIELLICVGVVSVRSQQDYRMNALESRVVSLESVNTERRLTRIETQAENIEMLLKAVLIAVIGQLVGTGWTVLRKGRP